MAQLEQRKPLAEDKLIEIKKAYSIIAGLLVVVTALGMGIGYAFFWDKPEYSSPEDYELKTAINNVKSSPKDPDLRIELGWVYLKQGNSKKALEEYRNALKIDPKNVGAKLNVAMVYAHEKDYTKAQGEMEKIIKEYPTYMDARVALGSVYYQLKKYDKALEQYQFALAANPGTVDYIVMIGKIYEVQGKKDQAKAQYQKALEYVPDFQPALAALKDMGVSQRNAPGAGKPAGSGQGTGSEGKGGDRPKG